MSINHFTKHSYPLLDHNSPIPLHYQLSTIIREEIVDGNLIDENGKMLTEAELTKIFKVSRITVRNALKPLVEEGILWRERGKGTFLKTNKAEQWHGHLMGLSETIESAGFRVNGKILEQGMVHNLPEKAQQSLQRDDAWKLKRIRYADDQPIAIEMAFFIPEIGLELEKQEGLNNLGAYAFIENDLNTSLHEAIQVISAINASETEAGLLHIQKNDALIYTERLTKAIDGRPVEMLEAVFRPDFFQYMINLKR